MKSIGAFCFGILLSGIICAGFVSWQNRNVATMFERYANMQGDGMVLFGQQAASALSSNSPQALQDFANYVLDSGIYQMNHGVNSGAYSAALHSKLNDIPKEKRHLSADAPALYMSARKSLSAEYRAKP